MRIPALGLFGRLAYSLGALLCVALLTLGYVLLDDAERRFNEEKLEQTRAHARSLAEGSLDALVTGDYELLERWVASAIPGEHYAYAFLARSNGQILTHSDPAQVARFVIPVGELTKHSERDLLYGGRSVKEIIHPAIVGRRHLANAHVAYFLDQNTFFEAGIALKIGLVLMLFLFLLLAASLLIIRRHTEPLTHLTALIAGISPGDPEAHIGVDLLNRKDEVGSLANAFEELTIRLRFAFKELTLAFEELRGEEGRLKMEVEKRTGELRAANKELESFSYTVSHDLRSPLRSIMGFSQILKEDAADKLTAEETQQFERIIAAANRMAELIDDILKLGRVTRSEVQHTRVDLTALARAAVERLRSDSQYKDIDWQIEEDLTVVGDKKLLALLLDNLLGNACKYSSKKTRARIEFGHTAIAHNGKEGPAWFVRDNGVGFDVQYADKLFKPFHRLHSDEVFEGTGIGLATVQRIIHRHGGRIWAEAEEGKGATFFFTIPEE